MKFEPPRPPGSVRDQYFNMDHLTRRHFIVRSSSVAIGFASLKASLAHGAVSRVLEQAPTTTGFGALIPDPDGVLDLPKGFTYRIIGAMGETMTDGLVCPGKHDAMAAFPYTNPDNSTDPDRCILVRNHEIEDAHRTPGPFGPHNERLHLVDRASLYDHGHGRPSRGGCTTVVYNMRTKEVERSWLSLAATERNCAGGLTPWGSWISCEETVSTKSDRFEQNHGYVFEVPVTTEPELAQPVPLKAMGRFNHEAVCINPETGIVYLTEDRHDSLLYRFVPQTKPTKPGDLRGPGKLQALRVLGQDGLDTRNWDEQRIEAGDPLAISWIDLDDIDSPNDDLRTRGFAKGAARFARGEGMWWGAMDNPNGKNQGAAYFACTNGGKEGAGQIFRLTPGGRGAPDTLELFIEPNDRSVLENADNITFSPWGDLVVCEDGQSPQHLVGVKPDGSLYTIAKNAYSGSEFAGACFSPDESTLFVNMQGMGWTLAITGPWNTRV